jgi:hypothetical protein
VNGTAVIHAAALFSSASSSPTTSSSEHTWSDLLPFALGSQIYNSYIKLLRVAGDILVSESSDSDRRHNPSGIRRGWLCPLAAGLRGYIDHNGVVGLLLDAYPSTLLLNGEITLRGGDYGRCVVSTCGFLWNVPVA